jgi:hypothetical protein
MQAVNSFSNGHIAFGTAMTLLRFCAQVTVPRHECVEEKIFVSLLYCTMVADLATCWKLRPALPLPEPLIACNVAMGAALPAISKLKLHADIQHVEYEDPEHAASPIIDPS